LAAIGAPAVNAIPALKRAALASAPDVKAFSLFAIWRVTGEESGAPAALATALTGTIWEVPLLHALGQMGSLATPHVGRIVEKLESEDASVRQAAARALGGVPSATPAAATALAKALADPSSIVRAAATTSLAAIAAGRDSAILLLAPSSADRSYVVRQAFCRGVLLLGARASSLCERLVPLLDDEKTGELAMSALRSIGTERAVSALVEGCRRSGSLRLRILTTLGEMGPVAAVALPCLRGLLNSAAATAAEREAAGKAIASISAE
jgi:HEAT repeat protein